MANAPDSPQPDHLRSSNQAARHRAATLETESSGAGDSRVAAVLAHGAGSLYDHLVGDREAAIRCYRRAYKLDGGFTPALLGLQRLYLDSGDYSRAGQVIEARHLAADEPALRADLLTEHAIVVNDLLGDSGRAEALLEAALDADPECRSAALMLEHQALSRGEAEDATLALEARASQVYDPALRGVLQREIAMRLATRGDFSGADKWLRRAAELGHGRYATYSAQHSLALARGHGGASLTAIAHKIVMCLRFAAGKDRDVEEDNAPLGRFVTPEEAAAEAATLAWEAAAHHQYVTGDHGSAKAALSAAALHWPTAAAHTQPGALPSSAQVHNQTTDPAKAAVRQVDWTPSAQSHVALLGQYASICWSQRDFETFFVVAAKACELLKPGRDRSRFLYHQAEAALALDRDEQGIALLRKALEDYPDSPVVAARLEHALQQSGQISALCSELARRAEQGNGGAPRLFFKAGYLAARLLDDGPRAATLLGRCGEFTSPAGLEGQRLLFAEAHRAGWPRLAQRSAERLARHSPHAAERSFFARLSYRVGANRPARRSHPPAPPDADAQSTHDTAGWAPHLARVLAAERGDSRGLADAHVHLSQTQTSAIVRSAHYAAAATAVHGLDDTAAALHLLDSALSAQPDNTYALALACHLLESQGDAPKAMALLLRDAQAHRDHRRAASQLVAGGRIALSHRQPETAIARLSEALERDPSRTDAWFGLWYASLTINRVAPLARALRGLVQRRLIDDCHLEASELSSEIGDIGAADQRAVAALDNPENAPAAALRLLASSRDQRVIEQATTWLEQAAPERCWRLTAQPRDGQQSRPSRALLGRSPLSEVVNAIDLLGTLGDFTQRAGAWATLAEHCEDAQAFGELTMQSVCCDLLAGGASHLASALDKAQALHALDPNSILATAALGAALDHKDSPALREMACRSRLKAKPPGADTTPVRLQWIQTLLETGSTSEALAHARALVRDVPQSPACLEALLYTARCADSMPDVVAASEALVPFCDAQHGTALLFDAAQALLQANADRKSAVRLLQQALTLDGGFVPAFAVLHDLLVDEGSPQAVLECIEAFVAEQPAPDLEVDARYQAARLYSADQNPQRALPHLIRAQQLAPQHIGVLSLLGRTYHALDQHRNAVQTLVRLAEADVPDDQRRVARLGAADFLLGPLADRSGAISQLRALDQDRLATPTDLARLAELLAETGQGASAIAAYTKAADGARDVQRCQWLRAAGRLHERRQGHRQDAILAYRSALLAVPTDRSSHGALYQLLDNKTQRAAEVDRFLSSIQHKLITHPTDPDLLRALRVAGHHGAMPFAEFSALDALLALRVADHAEQTAHQLLEDQLRRSPRGALTEDEVRFLTDDRLDVNMLGYAQHCADLVAASMPAPRDELKLKRRHRCGRRVNTSALQALLGRLSLNLRQLYLSDTLEGRPLLLPGNQPDEVDVVARPGFVELLDTTDRLEIGVQMLAHHLGLLPLLRLSPASRVLALLALVPGAQAHSERADVRKIAARLYGHATRRKRQAIEAMAPKLGDNDTDLVAAFIDAFDRSLLRAGLLVSGSLPCALAQVGGQLGGQQGALPDQAVSLVRFWTSPQALALHGEGASLPSRLEATP